MRVWWVETSVGLYGQGKEGHGEVGLSQCGEDETHVAWRFCWKAVIFCPAGFVTSAGWIWGWTVPYVGVSRRYGKTSGSADMYDKTDVETRVSNSLSLRYS